MTTSLAQFQATTRQLWQAWQAKTITSDLIFEMVMQNPTLCTELVQRALPELAVGPLVKFAEKFFHKLKATTRGAWSLKNYISS